MLNQTVDCYFAYFPLPMFFLSANSLCLFLAAVIGFILSRLAGIYAYGSGFDSVWLSVSHSSVFNAVAYTGGPYPLGLIGLGNISLGYCGLGDLFVFIYFGLVSTMAVPYLHLRFCGNSGSLWNLLISQELLQASFFIAFPVGFLATAVIVVNNLRDRKTDILAGKRTLAARFGELFARSEYALLVIGSYLIIIFLGIMYDICWLVPLLSLPAAITQLRGVAFAGKDGSALNEHVGGTAKLQLFFCILFSISIKLSS